MKKSNLKRKLVKHHGGRSEEPYRHVLVAVAGQTPQIITETLYALMVLRRPPIPISEIFILTTARGAEIARRALLDREQGHFFAFCREYGFGPGSIAFDETHIITIKKDVGSAQGSVVGRKRKEPTTRRRQPATALDDIRTVADNAALAQQLIGFIKQLTNQPDTALHCSLAGGRKTMSAYMALALTLYGRQQDTLSHVLVSEEFESNPKFFFPPRRNRQIPIQRSGALEIVHTRDARIELAEIPFIRLRERLGADFMQLDQSVEQIIQLAQYQINLSQPAADRLRIDLKKREARWGMVRLDLSGILLAWYAYFADLKANRCVRPELPTCAGCSDCFQRLQEVDRERFIQIYRSVYAFSADQFNQWEKKTRETLQRGQFGPFDERTLISYISRINKALGSAQLSQPLNIMTTGGYGGKRYGLPIDKTQIDVSGHERETQ